VAARAGDGGVLERARVALTIALAFAACRGDRDQRALPVPGERGPRVTVEVLNASGRSGLARVGTRVLRRAGIDVVTLGNAPAAVGTIDSTRIVVRRGTAAAADPIRRALGVGLVRLEPDSARLLDATVLLGADFAPRVEFHP